MLTWAYLMLHTTVVEGRIAGSRRTATWLNRFARRPLVQPALAVDNRVWMGGIVPLTGGDGSAVGEEWIRDQREWHVRRRAPLRT